MPVDPQMQAILDFRATLPPVHAGSVAEARAQSKGPRPPELKIAEVASAADRTIPGPGGPLRLRVYTPPGAAGPFPLLVFFHGGGFAVCDLDTHDPVCRDLCAGAGCAVVSVDYRLAPEHRFPAAPDDCLAATRLAAEHAAELGADPVRVAVAGDSAGGTLAAVTALRARDEGGPALAGQLLIYPVTDLELPPRPSMVENGKGYGLTGEDMAWFRGLYLNDPSEARHPHASPLHAPDLRGLPPALVITAECDPLRDEGEEYAARLRSAGRGVALRRRDPRVLFFARPGGQERGGAGGGLRLAAARVRCHRRAAVNAGGRTRPPTTAHARGATRDGPREGRRPPPASGPGP